MCYFVADCASPLGMQNGDIPDSATDASSSLDHDSGSEKARLQKVGNAGVSTGWRAKTNDPNPWLQINLDNVTIIKKIATQGGGYLEKKQGRKWVKTFSLSFRQDAQGQFLPYQNDNKVRIEASS